MIDRQLKFTDTVGRHGEVQNHLQIQVIEQRTAGQHRSARLSPKKPFNVLAIGQAKGRPIHRPQAEPMPGWATETREKPRHGLAVERLEHRRGQPLARLTHRRARRHLRGHGFALNRGEKTRQFGLGAPRAGFHQEGHQAFEGKIALAGEGARFQAVLRDKIGAGK
nr:hypothetical protein [Thiorhodovibrio frisius]